MPNYLNSHIDLLQVAQLFGYINPLTYRQKLTARFLLGKSKNEIVQDELFQNSVKDLTKVYKNVWRWHGTGRFQYKNGKVVDVLENILKEGGLVPHRDPLDYTRGEMYSVSTSPSRTYSSLYAQLHYESGKRFRPFNQTAYGWLFYMIEIVKASFRHDRRLLKKDFRIQNNLTGKDTEYFHKKYTREKVYRRDMVNGGVSDIKGNYPVIIGIKEKTFQEAEIAEVLRKHESRSETTISINDFTHIEVPVDNVKEMKYLLKKHGLVNLPVYAIEFGEELSKTLPSSFIKHGIM